jgi:hypothetical protein
VVEEVTQLVIARMHYREATPQQASSPGTHQDVQPMLQIMVCNTACRHTTVSIVAMPISWILV